ncbi:MAG: aminopeptidase P family protein [Firmicutes bacterium]|nr:aminopeptidase P family protein [Bacillota bacterium]
MEQLLTPLPELKQRWEKLQEQMHKQGIGGALILQRADLFYFSGTAQEAHLFIPAQGSPLLLVRRNLQRARSESSLPQIEPFPGWDGLALLIKDALAARGPLGMELDLLPVNLYRRYAGLLAPLEITDISPPVRLIRAVKSPYELTLLHRAAALGEAAFTHVREICRTGMTEIELEARLEAFVRVRGHQGAIRMRGFNQEMFYSHTMAGKNAAVPSFFNGVTGGCGLNPSYPQGAGTDRIEPGKPLLIDFVTVLDGYMVDQTRIFCLGKPDPELLQAHEAALKIKKALIKLGRAGSNGAELYRKAQEMATAAGLEEHFMGAEEKVSFVGHGVGLELDELPVIARNYDYILTEGMVCALEPKFVYPGRGTVGIEDTFVVRPDGLEQITRFEEALQIL